MNTNEPEEILWKQFKKMFDVKRRHECPMMRFQEKSCKKHLQTVRNYQIIMILYNFM
jgi:hypothetical protein